MRGAQITPYLHHLHREVVPPHTLLWQACVKKTYSASLVDLDLRIPPLSFGTVEMEGSPIPRRLHPGKPLPQTRTGHFSRKRLILYRPAAESIPRPVRDG